MLKLKLAGIAANFLAGFLPLASAKISYAVWAGTRRYPRKKSEQYCWEIADKSVLSIDGERVAVYSWGGVELGDEPSPIVLLVHGWNGRATQYFAFIQKLVDHGYRVLAFDAPGHGDSSGSQTGLLQMSRIIRALQQNHGHFEAIIGHSFGFMAAVNAVANGVVSKAMIGISAPSDFVLLLKAYTDYFGLTDKAILALKAYLIKRYSLTSLDEMSIHFSAKRLKLPCLVMHDEKDQQVPISEAYKIVDAWQASRLHKVQDSGHSRILYKQDTVEESLGFLAKNNCAKLPNS